MPQIFELLGYPISDKSPEVIESRRRAHCPFMGCRCDGGGNRFMSEINLKDHRELHDFFVSIDNVPSGICSIQLSPNSSPWIICPRRLLYMGNKSIQTKLKKGTQTILFNHCSFPKQSKIGIWAEAKVKFNGENSSDDNASFDYTFDYVLCQIGRVSLEKASHLTNTPVKELKKRLMSSGHTLALNEGEIFIEEFPIGEPYIIEVMTSSTSGGNKKIRSCIPQAFEDSILGKSHIAPGINYRQVWARMASQMIVKSQAAITWGGHTIWVLQDLLADYISSSTALDLKNFIATHLNEVNILSFSYGNKFLKPSKSKPIDISDSTLYSGPIRPVYETDVKPSFQDIVLASVCPPKSVLLAALCKKPLSNIIHL